MPNSAYFRKRAQRYYDEAKTILDQVKIKDAPEIVTSCEYFESAINSICELDKEELISDDYLFVGLCRLGLAKAYGKVTQGVRENAVEFQITLAEKFIAKAQETKENSLLTKFSVLRPDFNSKPFLKDAVSQPKPLI